ncbi:hypothetical protein IBE48_08225 [Francisella philomiragia]|uniref:Uncharacterized protein n=1 Tax=Francisella philomiragia TaxID=28110 RepID=A0AAW3DAC6_9GAMM|nr:hypothetical protein [Francisella philomiragia]KFJ42403.1 hypothetical protein DR78_501 [Francisella philomiragia]MBK2255421.1 hypothetical protein [Francisella philomiragia]MBK2273734.1 hypothetical protein [Francisella philomiragia]MBK2277615.1 hypothetical protein [Francisella philomiragia]MBK2281529.1 hypothetical protein [Francisella philomiragia]
MSVATLTNNEKDEIRKLLIMIFGDQAKKWEINNQVAELITKAFNESVKCSKRIDASPRPFGFIPSGVSVASQAVSIANRIINNKEQYKMCIDYVALNYKRVVYMAANGI